MDFPRPQKISSLRGVHGVSSDDIVIVDAQTLLIPNFSYDGEAPGEFVFLSDLIYYNLVFVFFYEIDGKIDQLLVAISEVLRYDIGNWNIRECP